MTFQRQFKIIWNFFYWWFEFRQRLIKKNTLWGYVNDVVPYWIILILFLSLWFSENFILSLFFCSLAFTILLFVTWACMICSFVTWYNFGCIFYVCLNFSIIIFRLFVLIIIAFLTVCIHSRLFVYDWIRYISPCLSDRGLGSSSFAWQYLSYMRLLRCFSFSFF